MTIEQIMLIALWVTVAYLLGRIEGLARRVGALEWSTERYYQWLRLHSESICQINDGQYAPTAYPREELYKMYKEVKNED